MNKNEVTGGWRKLHNEKLRYLYSSPSRINKDKMGRACSPSEREEEAYRILLGKPEGKGPQGRPRRRWVDLREIGWDGMDWINLAQDRDQWRALVNTVMKLRVP
jgi:hypothetical protein